MRKKAFRMFSSRKRNANFHSFKHDERERKLNSKKEKTIAKATTENWFIKTIVKIKLKVVLL